MSVGNLQQNTHLKKTGVIEDFKKYKTIYFMLLPTVILVLIFNYMPLPGLIISFMDYDFLLKFKSPWVGFQNFIDIFTLPDFTGAILNTLKISLLNITVVFIVPVIFALLLNEIRNMVFKRIVQTVSYLPYFFSWASVLGIAYSVFSKYGLLNTIISYFSQNADKTMWLAQQNLFVPNVIILTIWKTMGWDTIIYLAAIAGIDPSLYEAAQIDGANKFKQCINITIPSILPTMVLLFILATGRIFGDNFELIYGLQNPFIDYEVISTITYKQGIVSGNYSVAAALSMVQGIVNLFLVMGTNYLSKRLTETSLW